MRLGETLVRKNLITSQELKEALDAQLIYGGHLGTCLIELGFVDEQGLGTVLAEIFDVPYATQDMLQGVSRYVVETLNLKLVEKHSVVPFRLEDKTLEVAMVDPRDLHALDELKFASGFRIRPWIAPEARIYQAMECHYAIPRRLRYITLCSRLDESGSVDPIQLTPGYAGLEPSVVEQPAAIEPVTLSDESPATEAVDAALQAAAETMCAAESAVEVASAALDYAAGRMGRCVLFGAKASTARLLAHRGFTLLPSAAAAVSFPIVTEPVLGLLRGNAWYRGPVAHEDPYLAFFARLGIEPPTECLILPVYLDDRLIALFYGDGGRQARIGVDTDEIVRLMKKLTLAVRMVRLKKQIHAA